MVTGDHPITAAAIAKNIGLITTPTRYDVAKRRGVTVEEVKHDEYDAVVIHGLNDIPRMSEADWDTLMAKREVRQNTSLHKLLYDIIHML